MADPASSAGTDPFAVDARADGEGFRIDVMRAGQSASYAVPTATQQDFSGFYQQLAQDFGTRRPHVFAEAVSNIPNRI